MENLIMTNRIVQIDDLIVSTYRNGYNPVKNMDTLLFALCGQNLFQYEINFGLSSDIMESDNFNKAKEIVKFCKYLDKHFYKIYVKFSFTKNFCPKNEDEISFDEFIFEDGKFPYKLKQTGKCTLTSQFIEYYNIQMFSKYKRSKGIVFP